MKQLHKFGLVMGANFEAVAALVVAYFAAEWLNEKYPKDFNWATVTYVFALILVARSWYVMLRVLIRGQSADGSKPSEKKSESNDDKRLG